MLSSDEYAIVVDESQPRAARIAAFHDRANWMRQLPTKFEEASKWMVENFDRQGVVVKHPGVPDDPELPSEMWVEMLGDDVAPVARQKHAEHKERVVTARRAGDARWAKAGWTSPEAAKEASKVYRKRK